MADKLPYTPRTPNTPSYYKETEFSDEFTSSLINSNDVYKDTNKALRETITHYQLQLTSLRKDHQIAVLEFETEKQKKNLLDSDLQSTKEQLKKYEIEINSLKEQNRFFS
ncbi:10063_t:CDS:1, partial [Acaulospora morrowiae]